MFNAGNAGNAGNEIAQGSASPIGEGPLAFRAMGNRGSDAGVHGDPGVVGAKKSRPAGRWPNRPRFVA